MVATARSPWLLLGLDLAGTAVVAMQGAEEAVQGRLDLLGVTVIAFVSALGGILRDLLIGAVPPAAIRDRRYPAVAFAAGMAVFAARVWAPEAARADVMVFDAAGLALFAVAGAAKALEFGLNPLAPVLMRGLTGVGGGVVRDVLLNRVPVVLRADFYATAALAGALATVVARRVGMGARGRRWPAWRPVLRCGWRGARLHWSRVLPCE